MTTPRDHETQLAKDSQWFYLAQWLELSPQERSLRGLPTTQAELATVFGLSDARILRKWRDAPAFKSLQAKAKRKNALRELPMVNLDTTVIQSMVPQNTPVPEDLDPDLDMPDLEPSDLENLVVEEGEERLEAIWRRKAETDPRAAKFYWDAWGKARQAAAQRAAEVRYDQETLEGLILEAVQALGPEVLVRYLGTQGWRVEKVEP